MNDQGTGEELDEERRREAFRDELRLTPELGGGRIVGRISKRVMWWGIAVLAVLGLGGQLLENYMSGGATGATGATGVTGVTGITGVTGVSPTTPTTAPLVPGAKPSVASADKAFIGLKLIGTAPIPSFTLTDQHGNPYGTAAAKGKLTLITFFNKNCNDICPVLGTELRTYLSDLGSVASKVNIIIVNTDPFSYAASAEPRALSATGLAKYANVHFVTGTVSNLNAVWKAYGIEVKVGATAAQVAHNSLIYFDSASSQFAAYATPFASENTHGQFSLSAANEKRFALGLKYETISLDS
jgi:cytochrome oxidase Cu insertion factor (SCO1/SenC/PrrC family)